MKVGRVVVGLAQKNSWVLSTDYQLTPHFPLLCKDVGTFTNTEFSAEPHHTDWFVLVLLSYWLHE